MMANFNDFSLNIKKYNSKIIPAFNRNKVVFLIIFFHCLITIPLAYFLNTHYDEACSLMDTGGTIYHTIKRTINIELQAPLYYLILNLWRKLDNSFFFSRLLSILFSSLSIFIGYKFLKRFSNIKKPAMVTFLIAINPFLIYYAVEIRLYTLMVFLSIALFYLMYEIYLFDNNSKISRITFIIVSIISLQTQYYMGFLLVAIGVNILIYKGWYKFKTYLIDMILPFLSLVMVLPFLGAISRQLANVGHKLNVKGIFDFLRDQIVFSYLFSLDSFPLRIFSKYETWLFLLILVTIFLFSIKERRTDFVKILKFKEILSYSNNFCLTDILFFDNY